ncbi:FG-GAP repeat domain-containing protein [Streptomyces sp. S1]|uniref:FG-GAP repeat domain-containing protein n=1 Tax=Streptomyces sp. S1 TaxID=718288 RepID=UPI003D703B30
MPVRPPGIPRRARAAAAVLSALACAAGLAAAPPATAAIPAVPDASLATPNGITTLATTGFGLRKDTGADTARADAYEAAHPEITRTTVAGVVADPANTTARPLCHDPGVPGAQGFCWSAQDDATADWYPQGVAQGTAGGRKTVVTSWYGPGGTERLTFADVTAPASVRYRHVQLVGLSADGGTYANLSGGHAHAVVWAGDLLYVASIGSGFDVFDTRRVWRTAAGAYVLPRIAGYAATGAGTGCGTATVPERPCVTGASLDLSGPEPALVTVEMDATRVGDRFDQADSPIVRWPLDPATGLLRTDATGVARASAAYRSPIGGAQGVAMYGGRFVISAPCPEYVQNGPEHLPSCLYHGTPDEPVWLVSRTGIYGENLSFLAGTNELWTVNERPGARMVTRTSWPAPPALSGMTHLTAADFDGDRRQDVVGVEAATGKLWLYPGRGDGTLGSRSQIGVGWNAMKRLAGGDYTGDGRADLLAVEKATGTLYAYPGTGTGALGARVVAGRDWGGRRDLTALDVDRNGKTDLVAVDPDGTLRAYPGAGNGTLGKGQQIGSGWDAMNELTAAGDMTGDGPADLAAVDRAGTLWVYPGNGTGGFGDRIRAGTNWHAMRGLVGGDLDGDGRGDLAAVQAPATAGGPLYLYPGTGSGGLGARTQIGSNW